MYKILLLHPGTQYSHQLAKQLFRKNLLYRFYTGFILSENSFIARFTRSFFVDVFRKLSNRIIADVHPSNLHSFPLFEAWYHIKIQFSKNELLYSIRNKKFQKKIPRTAIDYADVIIGFDTSSSVLISKATKLSKPFILDVSIAHSKTKELVFEYISNRYSNWNFSLENKSSQHLLSEQYELELSNHIVVASSFTKNTLLDNGIPESKISVNPYGVDLSLFKQKPTYSRQGNMKFIFVGLVDARKGIPLLLDVWNNKKYASCSLTIVGPVSEATRHYIKANYGFNNVLLLGKIPQNEIATLLHEYDVFVFPSFFEGFGLVILEAMACGLPIITTTATCGADIINNAVEGFVINPGDHVALDNSMEYFINNSSQVEIMGNAARRKAESFTWDEYGDRWEKIIEEVVLNSLCK